jgi:hypothetical protein
MQILGMAFALIIRLKLSKSLYYENNQMRKTFSWVAVLLALSGLTASAQLSPTLQITNTTTGFAVLSWSNTPSYFGFILQSTTNLSRPVTWNQRSEPLGSSITNFWVPITKPQEFFRLAAPLPIFSFAIFYNLNMEIDSGQVMIINGPVFCNQSIWSGSEANIFLSTVSAVGTNDTTATDPFALGKTDSGTPAVNFLLSGQPVSGVGALDLLFGTNNMPNTAQSILQLQLPPSTYALGTAAAYSTNGQLYLCNASDLIVSNSPTGTNSTSPTGTNLFVYFQDAAAVPYLAPVKPDFYKLKTGGSTNLVSTNLAAGIDSITNVQYTGYTFLTNALFYDWREGWNGGNGINGKGKAVQAIQIDIAKFNIWQTNTATNGGSLYNAKNILDKGHVINSLYVYNAVPLTSNSLPAVRVVNGMQLPSAYGFTIATPFPMYVFGNYNTQTPTGSSLGTTNTTFTYPAALMADAITILSTSWSDAVTSKQPLSSSTTVNAAMLTGIVPSDITINGNYSGGVENFMRLLENWNGVKLWYNGSIAVMFASQYATNQWQLTGNYYNAPIRKWAFDPNFKTVNGLPPLTPMVMNFVSP